MGHCIVHRLQGVEDEMSNGTNPTALDYFRAGRDTADIASILNISEALALEQVSKQRSAVLGKHDPYEQPVKRGPLVRYAGQ
jgi:hypothetical protein